MQCTGITCIYYLCIMELNMEHVFSVEAMLHGYHQYQNAWDAPIGEILSCERKVGNIHDTFAVAINPLRTVVPYMCHGK